MLGRAGGSVAVGDGLEQRFLEIFRVDKLGETRVGRLDLDKKDGCIEQEEKVDVGAVAQHAQLGIFVAQVENGLGRVDGGRDAGRIVDSVTVAQHSMQWESVEKELGRI